MTDVYIYNNYCRRCRYLEMDRHEIIFNVDSNFKLLKMHYTHRTYTIRIRARVYKTNHKPLALLHSDKLTAILAESTFVHYTLMQIFYV